MTVLGITFGDLMVTASGPHARVEFGGSVVVVNAAGQIDAGDFLF